MKAPKVSDGFRETMRHIRASDDGIAKSAWKNALEYVAELEQFKARILKAANE